MRSRRVFIDSSFVEALLDRSGDGFQAACATFDRLLVEFERGATLLYSHHGVVTAVGDDRASDVLGCASSPPSAAGSPEAPSASNVSTRSWADDGRPRWC